MSPSYKYDGTFTSPIEHGAPRVRYPFAGTPSADVYARTTERDFMVLADYYDSTRRIATRTGYTNLLLQSEALGTTWTASLAAISSNAIANPSTGEVTGDKVYEDSSNAQHYITQAVTIAANTAHTVSGFFKALERTKGRLRLGPAAFATDTADVNFDLTAGTVTTTVSGSAAVSASSITSIGGGWYRVTMTAIINAATTAAGVAIGINDGNTYTYAGNGSAGFYAWGLQLVAGTSAGPYIDTTTVARAVSAPDVDLIANPSSDLADPFAYLIAETDPAPVGAAKLVGFTRLYARIPTTQTVYSSRAVQRPIMHDVVSGGSYAVSFDSGVTSHVFTSRAAVTIADGVGYSAPIYAVTHNSHGKSAGDLAAVWSGDRLIAFGPIVDVYNVNTYHISFINEGFPDTGYDAYATDASARYVNGATSGPVSTKHVTSYYLPGVTAGISSPTDIPVVTTKVDPVSWLGEIVAYLAGGSASTYFSTTESGPLERFLDGPIYQQTAISAQMKDALETVSVTA
jgi:hypothetical protein